MQSILSIENLSVRYPESDKNAVSGVNISVRPHEMSALIGESGSGKSTVIMSALGLLPKNSRISGRVVYDNKNLLEMTEEELRHIRQRRIALVPQSALNSFTPVMTIGRHIREVLKVHLNMTGKEAEMRTRELLADVELPAETAKRYPHELSGGQKQRAAIAAALSCSPEIVLADEPTTALDVITQSAIIKLLMRLREQKNLTILLITHDLPLAASCCSNIFVMKSGVICEAGDTDAIVNHPKNEHTKELIRAMRGLYTRQ